MNTFTPFHASGDFTANDRALAAAG